MRRVADRKYTVTIAAGAPSGVQTIRVELPDNSETELSAWSSGGVPIYLFDGSVTLADAQNRVNATGLTDCLMAVPNGGVGTVPIDDNTRILTLYWDASEVNNSVGVTIRFCSLQRGEDSARHAAIG